MRFALDTNAYSAFDEGDTRFKTLINEKNDIAVPIIVIGELKGGFAGGNQRQRNEQLLETLLDAPNVEVVNLSFKTTEYYAEVLAVLKKSGKPIKTNDMWIAALCLEHSLPLLTLDKHFSAVPDLKLVKI